MPEKSKERYETAYLTFEDSRNQKNVKAINTSVLIFDKKGFNDYTSYKFMEYIFSVKIHAHPTVD